MTNRSPGRLQTLRQVYETLASDVPLRTVHTPEPADNDAVMSRLSPGALVVNATGLGKDAPGSPLTGSATFPDQALAWDLNYRGDLVSRSLTQAGLGAVAELDPLRAAGLKLVSGPPGRLPTQPEQLGLVPGCVAWLAGVERIDATVLKAATDLRVISRNGTGPDSIDLAAAQRQGIEVVRAAGATAQGVAELTLALALAALRHIPWSATAVATGAWRRWQGRELEDCTIGVVDLGAIGRRVAHLFTVLGATVVAHDPLADPAASPAPLRRLDELLAASDVVTLHASPPSDGGALLGVEPLALVRGGRSSSTPHGPHWSTPTRCWPPWRTVVCRPSRWTPSTRSRPHPRCCSRPHGSLATPHVGGCTAASVRRATERAVEGLLATLGRGQ